MSKPVNGGGEGTYKEYINLSNMPVLQDKMFSLFLPMNC